MIEKLSAKIHQLYCAEFEKQYGKKYWTDGDYSKLSEQVKEFDRNIARFIIEHEITILNELDRLRRTELIPCLKFANVDIEKQYWHIMSELRQEVYAEIARGNWDRAAEELVDVQTSCETLLYILKHRHGVDINAVKEQVQVKNRDRGYYEFPDCEAPEKGPIVFGIDLGNAAGDATVIHNTKCDRERCFCPDCVNESCEVGRPCSSEDILLCEGPTVRCEKRKTAKPDFRVCWD